MTKIRIILIFGLITLILSCATNYLAQDKLLDFPLSKTSTGFSASDLKPPGLAITQSDNQAFPDLYLFIDRTISPVLFSSLWKQLPAIFAAQGQKFSALSQFPAGWINQILLFRPQNGASFQAVLIGKFPASLIESNLKKQAGWTRRSLDHSSNYLIPVFESLTENLHIGFLGNSAIVLQSDLTDDDASVDSQQLFDLHIARTMNLMQTSASAHDKAVSSTSQAKLFGLVTMAMPTTLPVLAIRLQIKPVAIDKTIRIELLVSLLPRNNISIKSLKTGLKLAMVGLSSAAGLQAGFMSDLVFTEKNGALELSGLQLSEKGAANLLGAMLTQAVLSSQTESGKEAGQ